ncbi:MAG: ABC transporter substrate-binding protein, partial [Pseudomonadota bacterium]
MRRRRSEKITPAAILLSLCLYAGGAAAESWEAVVDAAAGQTVYFNAWGGDLAINQYVEWAADRVREDFGIELRHVRVADIAEAVTRIQAERAAGRDSGGSVDLLWINGENFAALKRAGLLYGPWAESVPNARLIDWESNPTTRVDGSLQTDGYELPWGTASLTLFYDRARVSTVPNTPTALLAWIERHPGRFSYPRPPAFLGTAFLKQLLLGLADDPARLADPVADDFERVTRPLWTWLDRAHPAMWRRGRLFPQSGPAQRDLLAVGELDWMLSYNPAEASRAIQQGELHDSIAA